MMVQPLLFYWCTLAHRAANARRDFEWRDVEAGGVTDLGAAIRLLSEELVLKKWADEHCPRSSCFCPTDHQPILGTRSRDL